MNNYLLKIQAKKGLSAVFLYFLFGIRFSDNHTIYRQQLKCGLFNLQGTGSAYSIYVSLSLKFKRNIYIYIGG